MFVLATSEMEASVLPTTVQNPGTVIFDLYLQSPVRGDYAHIPFYKEESFTVVVRHLNNMDIPKWHKSFCIEILWSYCKYTE